MKDSTTEFQLTTETEESPFDTSMQVIYQWNYDPEVEDAR